MRSFTDSYQHRTSVIVYYTIEVDVKGEWQEIRDLENKPLRLLENSDDLALAFKWHVIAHGPEKVRCVKITKDITVMVP